MRGWYSHKRMGVSALVLTAMLVLSMAAWGQTATSGLVGTVTDPQGAAVVGAQVSLTSRATGAVRSVRTNEQGLYRFTALAPGRYDLRVEVEGFRTAVRENLELPVSITVEFNVTLELGAVTETIVIEEGAAQLNTQDASLGNVISGSVIGNIPIEGRNIVGLLSVQAGATYIPTSNPNTVDPRYGSVSGARADQSNVTLDGVDVNDPQNQTAYTTVLSVTLDAVQEFRVTTSNYDASMGRSSGAQVSLVTRSGTNEIHGTAYWYHRNTATSANEYFQKLDRQPTPLLQKHIYGAAAGGPLIKDRWFLFGNFEALKEKRETSVERWLPSEALRDGVMIYRCADPAQCPGGTVQGFQSSHPVPAGYFGANPAALASVDPLGIGPSLAASQHFRRYPKPNSFGRDGIQVMNGQVIGNVVGFRFGGPLVNTFYNYILRTDFNIDAQGNHKVFWRGNLRDDTVDSAPTFPGNPPQTRFLNNSRGMAIGYDAVLSPKLVNTFRYGLTRIGNKQAGLRNSNRNTFRFFDDFDGLTSTNFRIVPMHNFVNTTSYTHGTHSLQWGINFRFVRAPRATNAISFHTATTNGSWVPGVGRTYIPGRASCPPSLSGCTNLPAVHPDFHASYADSFINILAILSQASARYNYLVDGTVLPSGTPIERKYGSDEYEMYFQDSWRIRPNLTFNFGLRYGIYSPPWEVNGQQVAPVISLGEWFRQRGRNAERGIPSNAIPPFMFDLAGPANGRRGFYDWDYNNFAPRVSVAWSPRFSDGWLGWLTGNGKMVFRGGYSIVYDRIGHGLATQFDAVGSFGLSTSLTSPFGGVSESTPGVRFVDLTTMPPHLPAAPPGGFPATPPSAAGIITSSLDDTITTPYAHAFNFSIGREIPSWGMTVEAAYVGRRGRDLLTRYDMAMPVNLVDPVSGMDYFTAARLVIDAGANAPSSAGSNFTGIAPIPYWENLFPGAAGVWGGASLTATQAIARRFWLDSPDYITSLWLMDQFCFPACSIFGEFAYFNDQYDSLAGQGSIGWSEYHGLQLTVRRPMTRGFGFDFNYTLSKSNDIGSSVERGSFFTDFFSGGYTGFLINSWDPAAHYAPSDFDARHQFNFAGMWELPFGRGRRWASGVHPALNHVIGGWQLAGLWRWTSPFPFNVINCRSCWATNWNLQGNAMLVDPKRPPVTKTTKGVAALGGYPSPFADPVAARAAFRRQYPGEVGLRNRLRGDGYFTIDLGVGKTWDLPWLEGHKLAFRWETFNVTNTPKFDVASITAFPDISASFGRYTSSLAACDGAAGRCMQFAFRYSF